MNEEQREFVRRWLVDAAGNNTGDVLLRLSFDLTVVARSTYVERSYEVRNPKILRGINELQHRLLSRILSLERGAFLAPERDFANQLVELCAAYGCLAELAAAINFR